MDSGIWVMLTVLTSTFVYSLAGFANALIAMPLLTAILGIRIASPLMSIVSVLSQVFQVTRYRQQINILALKHLIIPSAVMVPFGVLVLRRASEDVMRTVLGLLILFYVGYKLSGWKLRMDSRRWAWLLGGLSGALHGAFNTPGPPVVVYGDARQWPADEFRSKLATLFLVSSSINLISNISLGNVTETVLQNFLWALPGGIMGLFLGKWLDRFIDQENFRKIVLVLLIALGARLALSTFF